jgi:hypothetical protein
MVLRSLGCKSTGGYYYHKYPDLCFRVSKRFKEYHCISFNESEDRKQLNAALIEEPPPSFSEVARRLRRKRDFVRLKFPELSKAITARYKHYQGALRKEHAERLRNVLREAVGQIMATGLYISEARVKEHAKQKLPTLGASAPTVNSLSREVMTGRLEFMLVRFADLWKNFLLWLISVP